MFTQPNSPIIAAASVAAALLALGAGRCLASTGDGVTHLHARTEAIVDVRVERRGEPLSGLERDAFELQLDGRPVTALAVEEIKPGHRLPRRYLVFIDDFFSVPSQRNRILDGIEAQLPVLGVDDRMAILAFDGTTVEILSGFTRSIRSLENALERARSRPSQGLLRLTEQRQFELSQRLGGRSLNSSGSFAGIGLTGSTQPDQGAISLRRAREITGQVARVLRAATAALYALPESEGRNVMLMLSGGWQVAPDRWVVTRAQGGGPFTGIRAAESLFAPLVESADQQGYTLYPVAVPNWSSHEPGGRRNDLVDEMLTRLAIDTGGAAVLEDEDVTKVLGLVAHDLEAYYRLRFAVPARGEDRRQRLRVDVAGGPRVRTRTGLADPSRQIQIACLVESAGFLARELPGTEALEVAIRAAAGGREVPLEIRIAAGAVTLRPQGESFVADLELRVARFDDDATPEAEIQALRLVRAQLPRHGDILIHQAQVRLPKKAERVLVSVYDPRDGTLLTKAVAVPR